MSMQEYRRKRKEFVLRFEAEEGLEVRASSTSLGEMSDLMDLAEMDRASVKEEKKRLLELIGKFIDCVKEWNLAHEVSDDVWVPTPVTVEGIMNHDPDFVLDLVFAWVDGMVGTPGPLGGKSPAGEIPMDLP